MKNGSRRRKMRRVCRNWARGLKYGEEELNMARKYNEDILVEITCNKCGKVEDVSDDEHGWKAEAFREFDLVYGDGSTLYDMSGVRFDLCEHCVKDIVTDFKIAAGVRDYDMLQGFNSEGSPFVYLGFEGDEALTEEQMDEMYERFMSENQGGKLITIEELTEYAEKFLADKYG